MSTIKVNKIENTSTTDGGVEIDSSGHVQVDGLQMPTAGPLNNRNLIINGDMRIAQRGTSQTTAGYGSIDRYSLSLSGATATMSQESFTIGQTDVPGAEKYLKLAVTTGNNNSGIFYKVEARDVLSAIGGQVTLSYYAKGTSPGGGLGVGILWYDGSNVSPTEETTVTLTSGWVKYTHTFDVPSINGLTLTNASAYLEVHWMQLNSDTGTTAYEVNLAQVQLEVGEKATPFEHRSYGDELARCQRYFETCYQQGLAPGSSTSQNLILAVCPGNINRSYGHLQFQVKKRAAATIVFYSSSGASGKFRNASQGTDITMSPACSFGDSGIAYEASSGIVSVTDRMQGLYTAEAEL